MSATPSKWSSPPSFSELGTSRYDRRTILLHWMTAGLVAMEWLGAQVIDWFPRGPLKKSTYARYNHARFDVRTASDRVEATRALEAGAGFDLLFTDVRMPGRIDGCSVARAARVAHPHIAVIYATGFSDEQTAIVDGGVFLKKPYRFTAILEHARRVGVHPDL